MTAYDLPHCTAEPIGEVDPYYVIRSEDGWYIHLTKRNPHNLYKTCVMLAGTYDWESIEIVAEEDLPDDAKVAR